MEYFYKGGVHPIRGNGFARNIQYNIFLFQRCSGFSDKE
jgi:hypothetical protein